MKTKQSKAAFVRSLPPDTPAAEVIKKAGAAGMKLSAAYVYVIRSKGGAKKKGGAARRQARGRSNGKGIEQQFVSLALDMGFGRAQQLLNDVKARVSSVI
jgi:hypothetical protein